ncbi:N-acetylmuramoyl-L-alanine amidase [Corynebacterium striatum]
MSNAFKCDLDILTTNDDGIATSPRRLLAVHTFEGQDLDARAMANYQLNPSAGGSYHLVIDRAGVTARENDDEFIPWAAMPTGNRAGFHFSLAGRAAMTRDEWLARPKQLAKLAEILAAYSREYGIPLVRLTAAEVRAGKSGVCGHAEISDAWRESDHTDPGKGFPYDHVLDLAAHPSTVKETTTMDALDKKIQVWDKTQHTAAELIANTDSRTHIFYTETLPRIESKLDQVIEALKK